jgi:hippurate hydrolase
VLRINVALPVSEDFGSFGSEWQVPSLFWYVGGTDPDLYRRAEEAGRIAGDVPTNHSSKFAPVLHPTLETGIQTLTTASLSYLGRWYTRRTGAGVPSTPDQPADSHPGHQPRRHT